LPPDCLKLDAELITVRGESDGFDETAEGIRCSSAALLMRQSLGQLCDFLPIKVGHTGVQQWRGLGRSGKTIAEIVLLTLQGRSRL
jgi:hypothetical protein